MHMIKYRNFQFIFKFKNIPPIIKIPLKSNPIKIFHLYLDTK